ncbi:adenylate/guanylate cyclase domain-containing protein [Planoprotostelium fungivorum]|uniref:Adenylate/guanylate cyclase domain-containing protein n=1 Tax=Planoprotostelium fungivorum TaxID=1890364 RepID=A0A2P6P0G1_9EUKA|nr:adenylate/guanylate cyclase domain-containing protein [Planoprotostelium fungivorum]
MSNFLDYAAEVASNNSKVKSLETNLHEARIENERLREALKDRDTLLGDARERIVQAERDMTMIHGKLPELETHLNNTKSTLDQTLRELHSIQWKLKVSEARATPPVQSREPPTGTVVIVSSSIQNYVQLWDAVPIAMSESLFIHNVLFRRMIEKFGGYESKNLGDHFEIAFSSLQDASRFCLEVQEELISTKWPNALLSTTHAGEESAGVETLPLYRGGDPSSVVLNSPGFRVRMALHTGLVNTAPNPITQQIEYSGQTILEVLNLESLAAGGQILVSTRAYDTMRLEFSMIEIGEPDIHRIEVSEDQRYRDGVIQMLPRILKNRKFPPVISKNLVSLPREDISGRLQELKSEATGMNRTMDQFASTFSDTLALAGVLSEKLSNISNVESSQNMKDQILAHEMEQIMKSQAAMKELLTQTQNRNEVLVVGMSALESKIAALHQDRKSFIDRLQEERVTNSRLSEVGDSEGPLILMDSQENEKLTAIVTSMRLELHDARTEYLTLKMQKPLESVTMAKTGQPDDNSPHRSKTLTKSTIQVQLDGIDRMLAEALGRCSVHVPCRKIADGVFMVMDKKVTLRIISGGLGVRVGGGYKSFELWLNHAVMASAESLPIPIHPSKQDSKSLPELAKRRHTSTDP